MNISESGKKALFVFGTGFVLFYILNGGIFKKKSGSSSESDMGDTIGFIGDPDKREKVGTPKLNPADAKKNRKAKDAIVAMKAFIAAYNAKEPKSKLEELNREMKRDMGVWVKRRSDGVFCVYDTTGKEIMSNG